MEHIYGSGSFAGFEGVYREYVTAMKRRKDPMSVELLMLSLRKEKEKRAAQIGCEEYSKLAVVGDTER
jgi:hypothetical protein